MNDENLKKGKATQIKSGEEAARMGRKGGKASVRVRRDKRELREILTILLELPYSDAEGHPGVSPITGKPLSNGEALMTTAFQKAMGGNMQALDKILDILGVKIMKQETTGEVKVEQVDNRTPEEIMANTKRLEKLRRMIEEEMGEGE